MVDHPFYLERQPRGAGPGGRWARFEVLDQSGSVVGAVLESHDARVEYIAAAGQPGGRQFRSYGHGTAALALYALAEYLASPA